MQVLEALDGLGDTPSHKNPLKYEYIMYVCQVGIAYITTTVYK